MLGQPLQHYQNGFHGVDLSHEGREKSRKGLSQGNMVDGVESGRYSPSEVQLWQLLHAA